MPRNLALLLLAVAAAVPACDGGPALLPDAQSPARTLAAIRVVTSRALPDGAEQVQAEARFLRYSGVDVETAATLGGLAFPDSIARGSCAVFDPTARVDAALAAQPAGSPDLTLLNAGPLALRLGGGAEIDLAPQRTPDLVPFLSGVVYEGSDAAAADAPAGDVAVNAAGGDDLGAFAAGASFPEEMRLLAIGGADPAGGPVSVSVRAPIDVRWQPAAGVSPADAVYVELRTTPQSAAALVCHADDTGELQLPAGAATALPDSDRTDGTVWVAVLRTRTAPFGATGLGADPGVLVVGSRQGATVTVEP